jgi:hypothetical protein
LFFKETSTKKESDRCKTVNTNKPLPPATSGGKSGDPRCGKRETTINYFKSFGLL